jgi:hypothetical protein
MAHSFWPLFLLCCSSAGAQWVSIGVKGGVPFTDVSDRTQPLGKYGGEASFSMKRYTFGPTLEVGLPLGFRIETGALVQRVRMDFFRGPAPTATLTIEGQRAWAWQIPVLLKRRILKNTFAPYVSAGCTFRHIGNIESDLIVVPQIPGYPSQRTRNSAASGGPLAYGVTVAGGISLPPKIVRVEPEIRYTHWTSQRYLAGTEQVEFLIGVRWP